jgi:hypothetical protein
MVISRGTTLQAFIAQMEDRLRLDCSRLRPDRPLEQMCERRVQTYSDGQKEEAFMIVEIFADLLVRIQVFELADRECSRAVSISNRLESGHIGRAVSERSQMGEDS